MRRRNWRRRPKPHEDSRYHGVVTFFMEFHRDDLGPDIAAELFPGTDPAKLSFAEMVDFLKLERFGSLVDDEMDQQVFIMDLSFNPEITDELMVIYFDLNKEIFCITHESRAKRAIYGKSDCCRDLLGCFEGTGLHLSGSGETG